MQTFGFAGYDVAARNLSDFAEILTARGHRTILVPPQQHNIPGSAIEMGMLGADVVVVNPSSFQTYEEENLVSILRAVGKQTLKIVVWEDLPAVSLRIHPPYARKVDRVLVALPEAINLVKSHYGSGTQVFFVGTPHHWSKLCRDIEVGSTIRPQAMKKLGAGDVQPIASTDFLVYVPGSKGTLWVNRTLDLALEASIRVLGKDRLVFGFGQHPGERAEKPEEQVGFERAIAERAEILSRHPDVYMLEAPGFTNSHKIGASDVAIMNGAPNESLGVAFSRRKGIYYWDEPIAKPWLELQAVPGGKWFVAEAGGLLKVDGTVEASSRMEAALRSLLTEAGSAALRASQERNFPLPATWDTAPAIVDFLERL